MDIENHRVTVAKQSTEQEPEIVGYNYLMFVVDSMTNLDGVAGVREHAYSLNRSGTRSIEDLRTLLPVLNDSNGRRVVAGGGPTGVEAAAEFAESYPGLRVTLTTHGDVVPLFPGKPREHVMKRLSELEVEVRPHTKVTRVVAATLSAEGVGDLPVDASLWCGGFSAPPLARQSGLTVNDRGQVLVDATTRSISHPVAALAR